MDLDEVLRRRVPARVRVAQALALLVVIAVAAGLVVRTIDLGSGRSQTGAATPTAVPLGPILLLSNVSYGTVTLNGAPLDGLPPLVTTFRRGVNTVTLTAPPFHPLTCHVQWPLSDISYSTTAEGCNLWPPGHESRSIGGRQVTPVLIVEMPLGPDDLPTASQTKALAAVTATLQSAPPATRVPAGDYIATGQDADGAITSRRADTPLRAELVAVATGLNYNGDFCDDPGCVRAAELAEENDGKLEWAVSADVSIRWRFSSGGGAAASSPPWPVQLPETVLLTYDSLQGWSVDQRGTEQSAGFGLPQALTQDACDVDVAVLRSAAQRQGDSVATLHDNRLEGCEFGVQTPQGANAGHFVFRFGVLLAVDGPAHALLPDLPLAPTSEVAAVGG